MIELIPSQNINPENTYYYFRLSDNQKLINEFFNDGRKIEYKKCKKLTLDEIDDKIKNFKLP